MPDDLSYADSFNQKSKQIDQALKYTNGDLEKAKLMVAGQFNDVTVIKGKFSSDTAGSYGIFYIFLNTVEKFILNINTLILANSSIVSKIRIFNEWRTYYAEFGDYLQKEVSSALPAFDFINHVSESASNYDIYADIEYNNFEILTDKMIDIIRKFYSTNDVQCQIEIDTTNSLALENAGVPMEAPVSEETDILDNIDSEDYNKIMTIEKSADFVVDGRVIISPIRGIDINDLKAGDKIKVLLTGNDPKSTMISKRLNAVSDDGEKLPITIRVKDKFPMENKGFFIYGLAAKNVLVRIAEEEEVKIEPGILQRISKSDKMNQESKMLMYLSLIIGIIIILIIALIISI